MKIRDSGMPAVEYWESFFDPEACLTALGLVAEHRNVADFGCGYGTFTVQAAMRVSGQVFAFDIDQRMLRHTARSAGRHDLGNIRFEQRDFAADGSGLANASVDYAMLFNILHCEQPVALLAEAERILIPGGVAGLMHWRHDAETPRGPDLSIRPQPQQCLLWAERAGLVWRDQRVHQLPPWHYGLQLEKPGGSEPR